MGNWNWRISGWPSAPTARNSRDPQSERLITSRLRLWPTAAAAPKAIFGHSAVFFIRCALEKNHFEVQHLETSSEASWNNQPKRFPTVTHVGYRTSSGPYYKRIPRNGQAPKLYSNRNKCKKNLLFFVPHIANTRNLATLTASKPPKTSPDKSCQPVWASSANPSRPQNAKNPSVCRSNNSQKTSESSVLNLHTSHCAASCSASGQSEVISWCM